MMRYILLFAALWCCSISGKAQTDSVQVKIPLYSVRKGITAEQEKAESASLAEFRQRHLYLAGESMQKSTSYLAGSIMCSVTGGLLVGVANRVKSDGGQTGMYIAGGLMAGVALGCLTATIHFHNKAGRELRLSAGEVVFKF